MKKKAIMAGAFVLFFMTAGVVFKEASAAENGQTVSNHPMIGEMAPGFDLERVGGGSLSLEGLRGRYVVLHFGASW